MDFKTLKVERVDAIARVQLNRPEKANAMNAAMWGELRDAMRWADLTPQVRVVVISGAGKHFTSGIDLSLLAGLSTRTKDACEGRSHEKLRQMILDLQDCLNALERCRKPVIAAIHGACVGGGIDLIAACDMRYCTADAYFSVKEIDVGMVADVGTLQRLPHLIGIGMTRELAYTGRRVDAAEANSIRLVNRSYDSPETLHSEVSKLAATIAAKSPLAVRGTKEMITYARDHSVADGLNYIATWNAAMLLSKDLMEAGQAMMEKRSPVFAD